MEVAITGGKVANVVETVDGLKLKLEEEPISALIVNLLWADNLNKDFLKSWSFFPRS
mgnify:CR=1 FL=1